MSRSRGSAVAATVAAGAVFALTLLTSCAAAAGAGANEPAPAVSVSSDTTSPEEQILGRWKAPEPANQDAFVEFGTHQMFYASDGCNATAGAWQLQDGGGFTTASDGALTQAGCNNVPIPQAVWAATSVSFEGDDTLVLTDADGETTKLLRASGDAMTLIASWIGPASASQTSRIDLAEDGTWFGGAGCQEYRGTWSIEFTERDREQIYDDGTGAPATVFVPAGSAVLSIGPKPGEEGTCVGEEIPPFPLGYDTDYLISMAPGTFSVRSSADTITEFQPIIFHMASDSLSGFSDSP